MKYKIILFGFMAALITGCSSVYKASQTPDDVYYSPARSGSAHRDIRKEDRYEDYVSSQDDQYLRMKIRNRDRWAMIDDYSYWNDSRYIPSYSYNYYRNNWNNLYYWNNPYAWNNWYSPYYNPFYSGGLGFYGNYYSPFGYGAYSPVYITKYPVKLSPNVNRPSLRGYSNRSYNNNNGVYNRQGLGNTIKKVFESGDNNRYSNRNIYNNNNTYRSPERTYSPSSGGSSSGSSSSGSSSSGGVSRPPR
jgi:hypothetical protein